MLFLIQLVAVTSLPIQVFKRLDAELVSKYSSAENVFTEADAFEIIAGNSNAWKSCNPNEFECVAEEIVLIEQCYRYIMETEDFLTPALVDAIYYAALDSPDSIEAGLADQVILEAESPRVKLLKRMEEYPAFRATNVEILGEQEKVQLSRDLQQLEETIELSEEAPSDPKNDLKVGEQYLLTSSSQPLASFLRNQMHLVDALKGVDALGFKGFHTDENGQVWMVQSVNGQVDVTNVGNNGNRPMELEPSEYLVYFFAKRILQFTSHLDKIGMHCAGLRLTPDSSDPSDFEMPSRVQTEPWSTVKVIPHACTRLANLVPKVGTINRA